MNKSPEKVAAIIVAAGEGKRMEGIDKALVPLAGEPLLLRTTRPFQQCPAISQIVVVVSGAREQQCRTLVAGPDWSKVTDICLGGDRRQDSVAAGLKRLREFDWVVIHDGTRPLVTVDLIERGLEAARETGAAAAAVPVIVKPLTNNPGGFDRLGSRFDNASLLHASGVEVIISSFTTHNARNIKLEAGNAVRFGLPWDVALRAVTQAPASALAWARTTGRSTRARWGTSSCGVGIRSSFRRGPKPC